MRRTWGRVGRAWDQFGRTDPYWGVCSHPEYRAARLTDHAFADFFRSGEDDAARVLETVREHVDPDFNPTRALDYGCGVGRVTIPLARACAEVVGVDVSAPMLEIARRNCAERGLRNVEFALTGRPGAALDGVRGDFDFVHSQLVFQHVPPRLGEATVAEVVGRLRPGGAGALHFTYGWRAPTIRRALHRVRRSVPLANVLANAVQRRRLLSPMIPMYAYDLGRLFGILQAQGCGGVYTVLADHAGHLGGFLFFRKPPTGRAHGGPTRPPT